MDNEGKSALTEVTLQTESSFESDAPWGDSQHPDSHSVDIVPVTTSEDLQKFVALPHKIYADHYYWPGQIDEDELKLHDPRYNFPLSYLKRQLFLAVKNGEVVGRISAIINEPHNQRWNQNVGFFGHFECINDQLVADKLLQTAEKWVKEFGKIEIYGPFSNTYYDTIGVTVEGFDDRPTVGLAFTPRYYPLLIEKAGYSKLRDVVEVMAPVEKHYEILREKRPDVEHLEHSDRFIVRNIDDSSPEKLREEFASILELYNDSFSTHWMARPLEVPEWLGIMEGPYLDGIIPRELFFIAEDCGKPVAFLFHLDDANQKLHNNRIGVSGKVTRVKAYVIGIKRDYQKFGIAKWMSILAVERMKEMGYEQVSFSWIDAENTKSISLSTGMGGKVDKVYRLYRKEL